MRGLKWLKRLVLLAGVVTLIGAGEAPPQARGPTKSLAGKLVVTRAGTYSDITVRALDRALVEEPKPFTLVNVHVPYEGEIQATDAFIPFDVIAKRLQVLPSAKDAPIVLYCMSGRMSEIAATTLVKLGYTNVKNLRGGMIAWRQAGLPLTTR